jgi:hypothetical protein
MPEDKEPLATTNRLFASMGRSNSTLSHGARGDTGAGKGGCALFGLGSQLAHFDRLPRSVVRAENRGLL